MNLKLKKEGVYAPSFTLYNYASSNFILRYRNLYFLSYNRKDFYMKFYHKLYVGDKVKNLLLIKNKLRMGIGTIKVYIISLSNGTDQLDIFHAGLLKQKYLRSHTCYIIGIASSYQEAIQMVVDITKEVVQETGTADIKSYLLEKIKDKHL